MARVSTKISRFCCSMYWLESTTNVTISLTYGQWDRISTEILFIYIASGGAYKRPYVVTARNTTSSDLTLLIGAACPGCTNQKRAQKFSCEKYE